MASARIYVDGLPWEIMGNVNDKFQGFKNDLDASRSGKIYAKTEATVKMLTIENIKVDPEELEQVVDFFSGCATTRFNITVAVDEDCGDTSRVYDYVNCLLSGELDASFFENNISGMEVGYEQRFASNA